MTTPVKLHTGATALATVAWLLRLCAACGLLLVLPAQAATCSAYMGQASINELRIGLSGKSSTANQIEIHNSGNVSAAVWRTWQLVVYYKRSGRTATRKGGYYLSSGFTSAGSFIYNNSRSIYLRNRSSRLVDVALVDASGNFIDYVGVEGRIQTVPACMDTPSVVDVTTNSDASGNVSRNPDGGALPAAVSNTTRHTIGASNTCTAGASDLVVDINASPDNPIVNTSLTTYTITVANKSCSSSVSAIAVTTSGISTSNFSSLTYAASQGSSSQAASALNWNVGSLSAGSSATLTVTGKPRILGALTTTASVTAPSSGLVNTGDDSKARTITVRDRNYVGFTLDSATLTEGGDTSYSAVIATNLTATSTITVTYSVSGTATLADTDLPLTGTVLIDPKDTESDTETSIDFTIKNDSLAEPDKALRLTLLSVSSSDTQVTLDTSNSVMDITLLDDDDVAPDHLELRHASGRGLTCAADTLTLVACQDAACSTPYTGGISGVLGASQAATLWPATAAFVIAPGSSSTSVVMQLPVAGTSTLGVASALPVPAHAATCNFGSPACTYSAEDSGLLASIGHHVAESSQTLTLQAVRKADNSAACVPAFANLTRALQFSCSYANPSSGSRPVRIGGRALNAANNAAGACDGSGQTLSLAFNAAGIASTTLQYADAGQVDLDLSYIGSSLTNDLGLTLSGSSSFIAAPASLAFSAVTAGPIRAGTAFSASLSALNSAGAVMPNFGREITPASVSLSHSRAQPSGSGASNGSFTGSLGGFSGGTATAANLVWSEVGRIDLAASLGNYLGSGLGAVGSTGSGGAVGRFIPHHFDLAATPACGVFSYSGQPFRVVMTARNGLPTPGTTLNYDGSTGTSPNFAKALTLSDTALGGVGSFGASAGVAVSTFRAGVATVTTPAYSYTDKLTAPRSLALRATDSDAVSSAGTTEPAMPLRSGRLRVFNTFGSEKGPLVLPVQTQYWSGSAWVLNSADSCSGVPAAAIAPVQYLDHQGAARSAWAGTIGALSITGGLGQISVAAPPAGVTGSIDLAINLGGSAVDASCLASHPASSGAALPWLRARNGNCASGWSSDPSARVSFGIAAPETRKSVHVREMF